MKLYDYPLAFNPQKVKLALQEGGFIYQSQNIDIFNGNSYQPKFLKINPTATLPILVDGDTTLTESKEIIEYLDKLRAEPLGGSSVDRSLVANWLAQIDAWDGNLFFATQGDPGTGKVLGKLQMHKAKVAAAGIKKHPELKETYEKLIAKIQTAGAEWAKPEVQAANVAALEKLLDAAEKQLSSTKFLAGDAYSMADAAFTPILARIVMCKKAAVYIKPRANVSAYFNIVKGRPSYNKTFGPAFSPLTPLFWIVPALIKATFASLLNWY